jgi:Cu/Ag efflux protein CusF
MLRRTLLHTAALAALGAAAGAAALAQNRAAKPMVQVWKDPNCGCCNDWITHLKDNGFEVQAIDSGNTAQRRRLGMPDKFGSCHTAQVQGYVIEGHVPANDIHRLLRDKPQALGLSVPRMPVGSPGMDGPEYNGRKDPYDVLLVSRNGDASVFAAYHGGLAKKAVHTPSDNARAVKVSDQAQARPWAEAEVRRVDVRGQKLSLRHGEIQNLDMPPMTMVFHVTDPAWLEQVKPGDKIRFQADKVNGNYTVMALERMQ